uniref:UDP-N-acetylglucosamine 2-epimerase n=1 Tax=uncultured haloarchaeon TaxID=160804 RepID=A5YSQ1_9EURY|nr:UDP-N-acetylglucosamine 2-epimerase [uncultured haloarchaeon]
MKILSVVGARPQFVKEFAIGRALRDTHEEVLVHTGQHYDEELSDVFFETLGIPEPEYNLGVGSDTHGRQTGEMLIRLESVLELESPDVVLVHGDTNSTLAGAIATAKTDIPLAHVESGLRSFNRQMPEEINRVLTDHASHIRFVPSERAVDNLAAEGITESVEPVGDVMYDALLWAQQQSATHSTVLDTYQLQTDEYILATVHRAANTDDNERLEAIMSALAETPRPVVLPLHPRTEQRLQEYSLYEWATDTLMIIDPVGYLDFIRLLDCAYRVVTDSGGVQKEAFFLDTPGVVVRDKTEWTEIIESGWLELVAADTTQIRETIEREWPLDPAEKPQPYGDGTAAEQIINILEKNCNATD